MSLRSGARVRASKVGKTVKVIGQGMLIYIKGNRWKIVFTPENVTATDSVSETAMDHVVIELQESVTATDSLSVSAIGWEGYEFQEGTTVGDEMTFTWLTYLLMEDGETVEVSEDMSVSVSDRGSYDLGTESTSSEDAVEFTTASLETYRLSESVIAADYLTDNIMLLEVYDFDENAYADEEPIFEGPDPSGQYLMRTTRLFSRAYVQDSVLVIPAYALDEEVQGQDSAYIVAITITDLGLDDATTVSDEASVAIFPINPFELSEATTVSDEVVGTGMTIRWLEEMAGGAYWQYRKRIPVNASPDGELTDYSIALTAMYGAGSDNGSTVYLDGCKSDFSDLRFTGPDGHTQLGFGIETKTDGSTAKVWVKIPSIPTTGTYIYVYFGNTSGASVADMWDAFTVYDHFDGSVLDTSHWEPIANTAIGTTVDSSKMTITSLTVFSNLGYRAGLRALKDGVPVVPPTSGYVAEMNVQWSCSAAQRGLYGMHIGDGVNKTSVGTEAVLFYDPWSGTTGAKASFINGTSKSTSQGSIPATGNIIVKITRDKSGNVVIYWDGTSFQTGSDSAFTPTEFMIHVTSNDSTGMAVFTTDYIFLRAWTPNEPTFSTALAVETPVVEPGGDYSDMWLTPWSYRKSHVINAAAGAGANYQVLMHLMYGAGTDTTETFYGTPCGKVYLNEHCKTDFSDLRFTMGDGRMLDYWIESKTDGVEAFVWVEVLTDISSASATLYVYYGNADATPQSSGKDTFVYFTDFDDATGWTLGANASIVNGQLKGTGIIGETKTTTNVIPAGLQFAVDMKMEFTALGNDAAGGYTNGEYPMLYTSSAKTGMHWYRSGNGNVYWGIENTFATIGTSAWPATIALFRHSFKVLTTKIRYEDYAMDGTAKHTPFDKTGSPNQTLPRNIALFNNASYASTTAFIDYLFVRKIAATEPSHGGWGTEEVPT